MADYDADPYGSRRWGYKEPKKPKKPSGGWLTALLVLMASAVAEEFVSTISGMFDGCDPI
jgi:hypothetical protein